MNALSNAAGHFVGDSTGKLSQFFHVDAGASVAPEQRNGFSGLDCRSSHVHHHAIHGDPSGNLKPFAPDEHLCFAE
tara:strand:+ start:280 stop:507 length:228 start_codon:yes stop_codon:yes gene_type:complete